MYLKYFLHWKKMQAQKLHDVDIQSSNRICNNGWSFPEFDDIENRVWFLVDMDFAVYRLL